MKVYLDEDLSSVIAGLLRKHGIDATTAQDVGNVQLNDRAQLAYAARDGRAIGTANVVPSSFRGDDFQAIVDAIFQAVKPYRGGLHGLVLYLCRE